MIYLRRTRKALAEFDRTGPERDARWKAVESDADIAEAEKMEAEALRKVHEAFYRDTRDINGYENAMLVDITTLRQWLAAEER